MLMTAAFCGSGQHDLRNLVQTMITDVQSIDSCMCLAQAPLTCQTKTVVVSLKAGTNSAVT